MFGSSKKREFCHLCGRDIPLKKNESMPPICPVCNTDLQNPAEKVQNVINCIYQKGALGSGEGQLYITNTRVFWIKGAVDSNELDSGGGMAASVFAGIAAKGLSKGSDKVSLSIPLDDIDRVEDYKKMLSKGVTLCTKSGASHNFTLVNFGNPAELKAALAALVK